MPNGGKLLPRDKQARPYRAAIAQALRSELGDTHRAAKTAMRWTGASERTVKNWLGGTSGPSGEHLVRLLRHSDRVLEMVLLASGRPQISVTTDLVQARGQLAEIVQRIDGLIGPHPRGVGV